MKPKITVIGSINMDMITISNVFPTKGETVLGQKYQTKPGGKGANQAVAASRLKAEVNMVGMVGEDRIGKDLLEELNEKGVSTKMVKTVSHLNTGTATIILSDKDNRIIVIPGANNELSPTYIDQFSDEILESDLVLVQFEIPVEVILYCIDLCYENNIPIIVNPAPAIELPNEYWLKTTYITPNETEATQLFSDQNQLQDLKAKLITTVGDKGVYYNKGESLINIPAYQVEPIDTTGAGDTFNGALAVALAEKKDIADAIKFANAAAALSTLKIGAQDGMPTREEVERFLQK